MKHIEVVKESGEKEVYNRDKFCNSLRDAGAPGDVVNTVCAFVEEDLTPGIATSKIFRTAARYLLERNLETAARYNLKRGLAALGPAGFHFEHFIEVLLKTEGYKTSRNQILKGLCVSHEIDVIGEKDGITYLLEAKYHNSAGVKSHIDTIMYAEGRVEDIARGDTEKKYAAWLVTNTKFTETAITYARCRKIKMTGWRYPGSEGLETLITKYKLYPVTVLPSVGFSELEVFARENIMLAQDIVPYSEKELARQFGIQGAKARGILGEAHALVYGERENSQILTK